MDTTTLMTLLGMGTSANPVVGAGLGLVQLLSGMQQKKKAEGLFPQVPPIYNQLIGEYRRKARNAEVGTLFNTVSDRARNIASTGAKATLMTGNPMAYNLAMKNVSQMMNELLAGVQKQSDTYSSTADAFANKRAEMQFGVDTARYNQAMNQAMNAKKSGLDALMMASTYGFMPNSGTNPNANNMVIETPTPPNYPDWMLNPPATNVRNSGIPFSNAPTKSVPSFPSFPNFTDYLPK